MIFSYISSNILKTITRTKKIDEIQNVYFGKVYKFYLKRFLQFRLFAELNTINHDFYRFLWFLPCTSNFREVLPSFLLPAHQNTWVYVV